ncbi:MAG TPA: hypothetical protein DD629_07245 [Treponema sp.]|nr:hypothetical protein [Treponema sp.]
MKSKFCLVLNADLESSDETVLLEKNYQNVFKPLLSFLYSHKDFFLTIGFSGSQLAHYEKKHPESIELLHELTSKRQIEIIVLDFVSSGLSATFDIMLSHIVYFYCNILPYRIFFFNTNIQI